MKRWSDALPTLPRGRAAISGGRTVIRGATSMGPNTLTTSSSSSEMSTDASRGSSMSRRTSAISSAPATASASLMASMVRATLMSSTSSPLVTFFSPTSRSRHARSRSPTISAGSRSTVALTYHRDGECDLLFRAPLDGGLGTNLWHKHARAGRQAKLLFHHPKLEMAVDDRSVVGGKVCSLMPNLPAREVAPDMRARNKETHMWVLVLLFCMWYPSSQVVARSRGHGSMTVTPPSANAFAW